MKLSGRLSAIASFVSEGGRIADIGTDHGYLPIWLMKNGIAKCVTATDIREGPLLRAKSAALIAEETGISFLRSDGLKDLSAEDYDTVIIAGMGGETIIKIIDESGWNWSDGHRIILQPMTKIPELIVYLYQNGFSILDEKLAQDKNERYRILLIGKSSEKGRKEVPGPLYLHIGKALIDRRDPLLSAYLNDLIDKTEKAIAGIKNGRNICAKRLDTLNMLLREFLLQKERLNDGETG